MFKLLLLLGLGTLVVSQKCGPYEFYKTCTGCGTDACPTLKSLQEEPRFCTAQCRPPRCECIDKYKRYNGTCIPQEKCPNVCSGENEVYTDCGPGCPDGEVCPSQQKFVCPAVCTKGCFCKPGYYRDTRSGRCVVESECPCNFGESYYECTPYDDCGDDRCDALRDPNYDCVNKICPFGCFCDFEEGFRRDANGTCIQIEKCPASCPKNEYLSTCGPSCLNDELCPSLRDPFQACTDQCVEKCVCSSGFYRDESGDCVPESECPVFCGKNEVYYDCKPYDDCGDDRCEALRDPNYNCYPYVCPEGCACDFEGGFQRDANGDCVPIKDCPPLCPDNEFLKDGKCVCSEGYTRSSCGKCLQNV